jgi:hypothetical protein
VRPGSEGLAAPRLGAWYFDSAMPAVTRREERDKEQEGREGWCWQQTRSH